MSPQAAPLVKTDYNVVACKTCSFYFVAPEVSLSEDDWEMLYSKDYFEEMLPWWAKKRKEDRRRQLDWLQECARGDVERFLDVGCGEGHVLIEASARGWSPYGIDISDNRIDAAKNERIHFIKGSIFEASFPDGFFDSVYMNSVLEHVVDPMKLLREIKRVLRAGGLLFFGVPNEDSLYNDVRQVLFKLFGRGELSARLSPFKSPYHVSGFTKKSIGAALDEVGFEAVGFRNFAGEYEWRKYRLLSRPFFIHFIMLPVHVVAIPLRKRVYFEVLALRRS
ncbi:MAG: hypothetical protein AMJ46_11295 [Latescibacteria bacterium DG_63]|nr:MAG: hypothetical protein AMJ46_11295 [Latescibacteria bacterium DG_63]